MIIYASRGEMFTASVLKNATPLRQFIFISILGLLCLFVSKFILHSDDLVMYSGCFGVVFYVMFNPWLCLLGTDNKKYLINSWYTVYPHRHNDVWYRLSDDRQIF
jgi:hypothetical protein